MALARQQLFGLAFVDAPSIGDVVDELIQGDAAAAAPGTVRVVVTPNVDHLVRRDRGMPEAAEQVIDDAAWVLPDGHPIVVLSRWLGRPLRARLTGATLVAELWPRLVATGRPVLVVASSAAAAARIRSEHPEAVAVVAPMLPAEPHQAYDELAAEAVAALAGRRPDFVFVTLGIVKQELIIDALLRAWPPDLGPAPVMLAVGAAFDMYYGLRARAPGWVQRVGLEWFFRFVQEPRRLFRRYFIEDLHFVPLAWREWRATRVSAPAS